MSGGVLASGLIPASHLDLLTTPVHGVLTTLLPDGSPQTSVVWVDYDGGHLLLSTTLERQKGRNLSHNPRATLLVIDPRNDSRWIEVRGRVAGISTVGAEAHADRLTQRYGCGQHFYGDVYPVEQRLKETRVIVSIEPVRVAVDAFFNR
jgi:PPOX class probable F420-dependent enzyme